MDISLRAVVFNWIPVLPKILRVAVLSAIGRSPNAEHQDALTEIIIHAARPFLQTPCELRKSQLAFEKDWGVWGRMWISKYVVPKPEHAFNEESVLGTRDAVKLVVTRLCPANTTLCVVSDLQDVETEWTGYRSDATPIAWRPCVSEKEMYERMMQEVDPDGPTVLYMHGGAFCLMDPVTHRLPTSSLAQRTKGRVLSIRYRLAPQHMFPSALLDAFTAYLSLLSPPEGAFHKPVPASKIVVAGDSSGGGLAASLQLLLLTLARHEIKIRFHGSDVLIPQPPCAGLALSSPWLDITRCLPSTSKNARWDIIAPPPLDAASPPFPPDVIWPTSPPRAETYCTADMTVHPLVSPLAASSHQWRDVPPVYIAVGWEGMQDETEVFARRVHLSSSNSRVVFDGHEGMPHCFGMFPWNESGRTVQVNQASFCRQVVDKSAYFERRNHAIWTSSKTGEVNYVELAQLGLTRVGCGHDRKQPLNDEHVEEKLNTACKWRMKLESDMVLSWQRKTKKPS